MKTFILLLAAIPFAYSEEETAPLTNEPQEIINTANDISGFWKSMDEDTGLPKCMFAIYPYQGVYYGRIIGSYDKAGRMDDTIYAPQGRAPGVVGTPYYSGLDIIWGLKLKGSRYHGKILDPKKGNIYDAEVWRNRDELIVRGKFLFFGRNEVWPRAAQADFPLGFKKPILGELSPRIPNPK